ncbi:glucosamine 6-phosphate synthetase [Histoplasma capsulatum]|uniref:Glucosamine 6-phosphate synthetase n=1 Tax=Ajellomyces capsulatus TaxID=5037 RepID=A0A8A1M9M3_AJECA|nr:glucosamine 6-phosphate synthetase [Histoplasma capsulatum]
MPLYNIPPCDTRRPVNGDGFGVGFYTAPSLGPDPCIFTSTLPAWNCENLERLASKTTSSLIFAHVRATTEGALADNNCHPFQHNTLMWMHNGNLGGWKYIKRHLADSLADKWYLGVKGGTDSEWAFALFLDLMEREGGVDPSSVPEGGFGHALLREIMRKTICRINELIAAIPAGCGVTDVETRSLLNFAVTDGHTVVCTRYVSSKTDEAASLYFSSGTKWKEGRTKGHFKMERHDKGADIVLVASEPLTFERHNWVTVPTNSILTIHKQTVLIHPLIDEFYDDDPNHDRSSGFAVSKGLVSKAPGTTVAPDTNNDPNSNHPPASEPFTPADTPSLSPRAQQESYSHSTRGNVTNDSRTDNILMLTMDGMGSRKYRWAPT